jgi:hypothetical protein
VNYGVSKRGQGTFALRESANVPFYEEPPVKSKLSFFSAVRTPDANPQSDLFPSCTPFGRQSHASKTHQHPGARLATFPPTSRCCSARSKRWPATLADWRLRRFQACTHRPRPSVRCLRQPSIRVGAHLCPKRTAGRNTTICIRPLAIRRSLVPGRPFCPAAASRQARVNCDRPDQSSTRRYRRCPCSLWLSSFACVLHLSAWGSGVGSAGVQPMRNTQADGAPKVLGRRGHHLRRPSFQAAGFFFSLTSFERQ